MTEGRGFLYSVFHKVGRNDNKVESKKLVFRRVSYLSIGFWTRFWSSQNRSGQNDDYILISMFTHDGSERSISVSIVFGVGSVISISLL